MMMMMMMIKYYCLQLKRVTTATGTGSWLLVISIAYISI